MTGKELYDMIQTTEAGDTDRILDIQIEMLAAIRTLAYAVSEMNDVSPMLPPGTVKEIKELI